MGDSWTDEPLGFMEQQLNQFTSGYREGYRSGDEDYGPDYDITESFANEDLQLFHLAALASAAFGVRSRGPVFLAGAVHIVWWFFGYRGLEAIYSVLAGVLVAQGIYRFAALPTLIDVYTITQGWRKSTGPAKSFLKGLSWAIGWLLAWMRYV